jgi:MFS family permease
LKRYQAWLIIFSSFTIYAYVISTIGPVAPRIFSEFPAEYHIQGFLISLYSLMGFAAIFGGHLYDRFGPRTNALALVVLSIGLIILMMSTGLFSVGLSLLFLGLGAALIEAASSASSVDIYQERRGMSLNLLHFAWNIGSTIGPPTAVWIMLYLTSWRYVYIMPLLIIVLLSSISYKISVTNSKTVIPEPKGFISIRKTLPISLIAMFVVSLERAISMWLPSLLSAINVESVTMGLVMGSYWALMGIGRVFWSFFSDKLGYGRTILLTSILATLTLSVAAVSSIIETKMIFWPITGFFLAPIYPNVIAWITKHQVASSGYASGLTFTMGSIGSLIIINVIGLAMNYLGVYSVQFIYPLTCMLTFVYTSILYLKTK